MEPLEKVVIYWQFFLSKFICLFFLIIRMSERTKLGTKYVKYVFTVFPNQILLSSAAPGSGK